MDNTFELTQRQELVVWLKGTKKLNQLKKYGYVYYVSRKMKYAIVYTSAAKATEMQQKLSELACVKKVIVSPRQEIDMNFDNVLAKLPSK